MSQGSWFWLKNLGNLFDKGTFIWQWRTFILRKIIIMLQIIRRTKFWWSQKSAPDPQICIKIVGFEPNLTQICGIWALFYSMCTRLITINVSKLHRICGSTDKKSLKSWYFFWSVPGVVKAMFLSSLYSTISVLIKLKKNLLCIMAFETTYTRRDISSFFIRPWCIFKFTSWVSFFSQ